MPERLPIALRVLVNGASTVNWQSWMGGPRSEMTFPRATEAALHARGQRTEVRNSAVLAARNHYMFRTWERDVVRWSPDVVIIVAGHAEAVHLFLPRWFERHANRFDHRPGPFRKLYFRGVKVLWKAMVAVQQRVEVLLGKPSLPGRARRATRQLERYLAITRRIQNPLVVILEILPPTGQKGTHFFPGMTGRVAEINRCNRELVEKIGHPDVRYLEIMPITRQLVGDDLAAATGDGFHYSPELHVAVADELARIIEEWARTQPHLAVASPGDARSIDGAEHETSTAR
jgi:hypothetical protein